MRICQSKLKKIRTLTQSCFFQFIEDESYTNGVSAKLKLDSTTQINNTMKDEMNYYCMDNSLNLDVKVENADDELWLSATKKEHQMHP